MRGTLTDHQRQRVLDDLGRAGSHYRQRIYHHGLSGRKNLITGQQLIQFFDSALEWINHSIRSNRRPDGLFHAYNLVRFENRTRLPIRRLYEMLEGQVAVLSSGHLSAEESLEVLIALKQSSMYRPDQHSYLLYPNRRLPAFVEKNNIPAEGTQPLARCCGNCWLTATGCSSSATLPDEFTSTAPSPTPATSAASWNNSPPAVMPDW